MHGAAERADHPCSDAGLETERISNRDHDLAHAQVLRVGETHMSELRGVDSNYSKIGIGIVARHLGRIFAPVRQIYSYRARRVDDMAISQHESVRRDDETRAVAAELARSAPEINALFDVDIHNGRGNTRDGAHHRARICVE